MRLKRRHIICKLCCSSGECSLRFGCHLESGQSKRHDTLYSRESYLHVSVVGGNFKEWTETNKVFLRGRFRVCNNKSTYHILNEGSVGSIVFGLFL